jgi:hypothetical protein
VDFFVAHAKPAHAGPGGGCEQWAKEELSPFWCFYWGTRQLSVLDFARKIAYDCFVMRKLCSMDSRWLPRPRRAASNLDSAPPRCHRNARARLRQLRAHKRVCCETEQC